MTETHLPGTVVGNYRLDVLLGQGGMGSVYRATVISSGAVCAVKTMHDAIAVKPEWQKRFLREARAAMAAEHPNIVRIHEVFQHQGVPMLAMELLDGESLEETLEREHLLPLEQVARILAPVTSAVGTAHSLGIIHRDLKPENIFLTRDPAAQVKVLDFGIAKFTATSGAAAETQALTQTGTLMGTPSYMSPEQVAGEKKIDQRADVWSIGIILYRCLTGVLPTDASSYGELFRIVLKANFPPMSSYVPALPADVVDLVARMLKPAPEDRPFDLREVYAVLARHAHVVAPEFGEAVAPLVYSTGEMPAVQAPSASRPALRGPGKTLGLTPRSLRMAASNPLSSGTLAMSDRARPLLPSSTEPGLQLGVTGIDSDGKPAGAMRVVVPVHKFPWLALTVVGIALAVGLALFLRR